MAVGLRGVGGPVDVTAVGLEPARPRVEQLGQLGHDPGPQRPGRVAQPVGVLQARRARRSRLPAIRSGGVAHRGPQAVVAQVPLGRDRGT